MKKYWTIIGVIAILLGTQASGFAQKTSELFIPLGQSPGLSGKHTLIGTIVQVNALNNTITMADTAGTHSVAMAPSTLIYLDKSKAGLPNSQGTLADCNVGDSIEVKFVDNARSKPAEWVKVQKAP
jgi:cyclophilin family peptidyl-prolyl cis-trans isomerase